MTSYVAQVYRLSILIDKSTLFINSWLIRLSVDNVFLINTRSLSIVIDNPIPLSIGISTDNQGKRTVGEGTGNESTMSSAGERKEASKKGPAESADIAIAAKASRVGPAESGMVTTGKGVNRTGPAQSVMGSVEKENV
jgi:hypothetical protein